MNKNQMTFNDILPTFTDTNNKYVYGIKDAGLIYAMGAENFSNKKYDKKTMTFSIYHELITIIKEPLRDEKGKIIYNGEAPVFRDLTPSTMCFLMCIILYIKSNLMPNTSIILKKREIMQMMGIKNYNYFNEKLPEFIDSLFRIRLDFTTYRGKGKERTQYNVKLAIISSIMEPVKKGYFVIGLTPEFYNYIVQADVMPFLIDLLKVDRQKYPYSFFTGCKLLYLYNINYKSKYRGLISIKNLLKDLSFKTYDESRREVTRFFIEPFEKILNAIPSLEWKYCQKGGKPCTKKILDILHDNTGKSVEKEVYTKDKYKTFINLYIKYNFIDYPELKEKKKKRKKSNIKTFIVEEVTRQMKNANK